jgi:hypothetical protein
VVPILLQISLNDDINQLVVTSDKHPQVKLQGANGNVIVSSMEGVRKIL